MKTKNIKNDIMLILLTLLVITVTSCKNDDKNLPDSPNFSKVTTIKDMATSITGGSMGDWIAIKGDNFEQADSIMFNDVAVHLKDIYYEKNVLYVQVPIKLPSKVTNKVTVKTQGGETAFDFNVIIPNLQLTSMFNEYTLPGDTIKIYGKFLSLYEVNSSNTVVSFGGKESPVIKSTDTYITAKVPLDVQPNVRVKAINKKHNAEAVCPGYYQDKHHVITTFDSDFPYTGSTGEQWVGEWKNPKPTSGKYLRFEVDQASYPSGLGWFYLFTSDVNYTLDMVQHPDKYTLKFELNMNLPIKTTNFFLYYYWAVAPTAMSGDFFNVQNMGIWQTVNIPLEKIIPPGYTGTDTSYSLNIRVEDFAPVEKVAMYFDNFRIYEKE
ncbi:glycan-binding surface protein [uncultured Bacteroides sp.]|uniref:glycan-binding surface protein n=1 Tax=uncultured Bacteroides sp. TaxID=162156 RepID=UPI002AABC06F|nr:glycan-binding surface protein [uncultured Bacteroides sp.]